VSASPTESFAWYGSNSTSPDPSSAFSQTIAPS
jgi:hypothetical protein